MAKRQTKNVQINIKANGKDWKWNDKNWKDGNHNCGPWCWHRHKGMGGAYFLGFIGAVVYYMQTATSFGTGVLAVLKAIVWPAFVVYKLLGL